MAANPNARSFPPESLEVTLSTHVVATGTLEAVTTVQVDLNYPAPFKVSMPTSIRSFAEVVAGDLDEESTIGHIDRG